MLDFAAGIIAHADVDEQADQDAGRIDIHVELLCRANEVEIALHSLCSGVRERSMAMPGVVSNSRLQKRAVRIPHRGMEKGALSRNRRITFNVMRETLFS